jgi:hypothetical protein
MHIDVPDRRIENNTPNEFRQPFLAEKRPDVLGHSGVSVLLVFLFRILSVNLIEILRVNPLSVRSAIEAPDEVRVRFVFREFRRKVFAIEPSGMSPNSGTSIPTSLASVIRLRHIPDFGLEKPSV